MRVDLLKHNQETYEKVQKAISEGKKKIAVSHATGTGKSHLIAKLFEDYSNDNKLVLVPSTYISDQIQKLFEKYGIQNADIMLYQKLIKMPDEDIAAMDYSVIVLDEYHHNASTKVWGSKVKTLIEMHPESIVFGTSATPIKTGGVNAIDELFEGNCVSDLPLSESIARKIVPLPKYVGALYTLDDELEKLRKKVENATNTKEEKQEFYKKINTMRSQIEKSYGMPIILNKNIKDKEGKYIVFCKNKKHLAEIKDTVIGWFRTAGCKNINAYVVHSSYENKDAEYKAFCENASHNLHLLFCVDMLNEGLHLENISGVLLLRPTRSMIVFLQQIGRAIEANNTNTPVIIDAVNNFSTVGQGMELLREIKDAVAKEKESNPNFDDSELEDIDTFFVLEQVVKIQEMFKEIEERLTGDWENGLRHFDKYVREHDGDVLVPLSYKDEDGFCTGSWVSHRRRDFGNEMLPLDKKKELEKRGFIWDVLKFNFEKNVNNCIKFYNEHGKKPNKESSNEYEKKLGIFWNRNLNCLNLPQWKKELLDQIPSFYEKKKISAFEKFYNYVLLYKERYGKKEIKKGDVVDGFDLYKAYYSLKARSNKLTDKQIRQLKNVGIDFTIDKLKETRNKNLEIAKQAIEEGIIISNSNPIYKGINFYIWKKTHLKDFTEEELEIMNRLVINPGCMKPVKVIDIKNEQNYVYSSINDAGRALYSDFHVAKSDKAGLSAIVKRLRGELKNPVYKGFRFEYADDEVSTMDDKVS